MNSKSCHEQLHFLTIDIGLLSSNEMVYTWYTNYEPRHEKNQYKNLIYNSLEQNLFTQ